MFNGLLAEDRSYDFDRDVHWVDCIRCGRYAISLEASERLEQSKYSRKLHLLSGAVRASTRLPGRPLLLKTTNLDSILAIAPDDRDISTKARHLLRALCNESKHPGGYVQTEKVGLSECYAANEREKNFLLRYLLDLGWTNEMPAADPSRAAHRESHGRVEVSPVGWEEQQRHSVTAGETAFVAMWFDSSLTEVWEHGVRPAIERDCSWRAERIDLEEHNGDVVDRILGDIRSSRFLVAEFTGHRNGVYFEAGFALGLGIPVIWVCREDAIAEAHFDTSHFSHVVWKTPEDLREKLANRIRATIGDGSYQPPESPQ